MVGKTQADVDGEKRVAALREEEAALLKSLADSRYHIDIAIERGEAVWPSVLAERAAIRVRLNEIRGLL